LISSIRNVILNSRVKSRARRPRRAYNLTEARSIGILYEHNEIHYELMVKFVRDLKEAGKNVQVIGFKNEKKTDSNVGLHPDFELIYKENLNLLKFPKKERVKNFIDEPFDILMDLSLNYHNCNKYILGLSTAAFKVSGSQSYQMDYADLTIDITKDQRLEYLTQQIKHYLNLVNQKSESYAV